MTDADLALVRHLAEKLMGWAVCDEKTIINVDNIFPVVLIPNANYKGGQGPWYVHDEEAPLFRRIWNPLEDANANRELIEKLNRKMAINRDMDEPRGLWWVSLHGERASDNTDRSSHGPTFERASCLAIAKATGWTG